MVLRIKACMSLLSAPRSLSTNMVSLSSNSISTSGAFIVVCAWCNCIIKTCPNEKDVISHGMCRHCYDYHGPEILKDAENFIREKKKLP